MRLKSFRIARNWSQLDLAGQLGLKSRGQIADIENGKERPSADIAIKIDRLSAGVVSVRELRPDLHDVRVLQPESGAAA